MNFKNALFKQAFFNLKIVFFSLNVFMKFLINVIASIENAIFAFEFINLFNNLFSRSMSHKSNFLFSSISKQLQQFTLFISKQFFLILIVQLQKLKFNNFKFVSNFLLI